MDLEAQEGKPLLGARRTAADKFLYRADNPSGAEKEPNPKEFLWRLFLLVPAQVLLFTVMIFVVCKFWYYYPCMVLLGAGLAAERSLAFSIAYKKEPWQPWVGRNMLIAILAGTVVGLGIFYRSLAFYYHYQDTPKYVNIAASQSASTVMDAGVVGFTAGSIVDGARSVGYQSAMDGATICIAPIVDAAMPPGSVPNFYAYGVNCCAYRGSFRCDSAMDDTAHSGMVRVEMVDLVPPVLSIFASGISDEGLAAAVKLQQALFSPGKESDGKVFFARYVKDPLATQLNYVDTAIFSGVTYAGYFCIILFVAACWIALGTARILKIVRSYVR